jgi:hypothetical protein
VTLLDRRTHVFRPCLEPRCPELVDERRAVRCSEHALIDAALRAVYTDARWQPARHACFMRDGYRCSCGYIDTTGKTLNAHHVPRLRVVLALQLNPFDVDRLETKCPSCHSRLTAEGE